MLTHFNTSKMQLLKACFFIIKKKNALIKGQQDEH